jgi:hypothetical protein
MIVQKIKNTTQSKQLETQGKFIERGKKGPSNKHIHIYGLE